MFILASGSPRRRELLEQIGCSFQVEPSGAKEITEAEDPVRLVVKNAEIKASATAELHPGIPVLAADTVVFMDKDIYGKPKDADDAARMLRELSGKEHNVATGMVIAAGGNLYSDASVTRVRLARLMRSGDILIQENRLIRQVLMVYRVKQRHLLRASVALIRMSWDCRFMRL